MLDLMPSNGNDKNVGIIYFVCDKSCNQEDDQT